MWKTVKKESIIQYKMRVEIAGQQGLGRQTTTAVPTKAGLGQVNESVEQKTSMIQDSAVERCQTGV